MNDLRKLLPQKIYDVIERAGISSPKQVMIHSVWDIKRLTNLRTDDITLLKNRIADEICPKSVTGKKMLHEVENKQSRVSTGCEQINSILDGGYRRGVLTEIFGESGSGKTQMAIQAAVHNLPDYCVYICTEDLFPIKRFNEIKKSIPNYSPNIDYGKNIFVEHITEAKDLLSCAKVRLPKLLSQNKFSLIVVDSIAAPFRVESTNYVQRAEELRELAILLINLAQEYNLAVVCINQVTASFETSVDILPSLGLAWSNMVSTRLWLKKSLKTVDKTQISGLCDEETISYKNNLHVRHLSIVFSPDLPNSVAKFVVTSSGIQGLI